ncbi:MAG: hypothetical protein K9L68_00180 [Spirochaetales bacterium]|nr:hypothetical protein [Spirochaetales bacterium]
MEAFFGVDIGTYSSKGVLVDRAGTIQAECRRSHGLSVPRAGWAEHDADSLWWADFCSLTIELSQKADSLGLQPAGIGISAIAPCVLPVDEQGRPLRRGILYGIDTRASEQIKAMEAELGSEQIRRIAGSGLDSQSAGPKIRWVRENEPEIAAQTRYWLTSTSYLVYRLTGRAVIDRYTASFFRPLYNLAKGRWSVEAAASVCPVEQLPELTWTTETAGTIGREASKACGLPEGLPVIAGTADAAAEAVSAGVLEPGDSMIMFGSSLFIITLHDTLQRSSIFWPAVSLFPGTWALTGGMATSGAVTQWMKDNIFAGIGGFDSEAEAGAEPRFSELTRKAGEVPPGAEGLLMLPYMSGERTPVDDPLARGVLAGLSLRHGQAHLYRAALEAVGYGIRHNLEEMAGERRMAGEKLKKKNNGAEETAGSLQKADPGDAGALAVVGGGAKSPVWMQLVADITGRSLSVFQSGGAAYGDAILAAYGTGVFPSRKAAADWKPSRHGYHPNPENRNLYDRYYRRYRELYGATASIVHELAGETETPKE